VRHLRKKPSTSLHHVRSAAVDFSKNFARDTDHVISQPCRLCLGANKPPLMLFTLCSGAFPLVLQGTNHAAFDQLACGVFLVDFRWQCVSAQFWDSGVPKLKPPEVTHTQTRGYAFALGAHSKWDLFSLRAAPPRHITPRTGVGTYHGGIAGSSGAPYRRRHRRRHRRFLAGGARVLG
jgi:hypothetical protein